MDVVLPVIHIEGQLRPATPGRGRGHGKGENGVLDIVAGDLSLGIEFSDCEDGRGPFFRGCRVGAGDDDGAVVLVVTLFLGYDGPQRDDSLGGDVTHHTVLHELHLVPAKPVSTEFVSMKNGVKEHSLSDNHSRIVDLAEDGVDPGPDLDGRVFIRRVVGEPLFLVVQRRQFHFEGRLLGRATTIR